MYYLNDEYLGHYSNQPDGNGTVAGGIPATTNEEDFGLDVYEPLFFRNPHEWTSFGTFTVKLRIDDENQLYNNDMFYFCHIHEFMGGRIKLTKDGKVVNKLDIPSLGYSYDEVSEFDKECGTFGLSEYALPNPVCPEKFVCFDDDNVENDSKKKDDSSSSLLSRNDNEQPQSSTELQAAQELRHFGMCLDAMNCHMLSGMTTGTKAKSEGALFVHQMIPHHQNAVNMAKALLKTQKVVCDDLSNDEDPDCILEAILYEIVNTQNLQIQAMYDYLDAKRLPEVDNCNVYVETIPSEQYLKALKKEEERLSGRISGGGGATRFGSASILVGLLLSMAATSMLLLA